LDLAAKTDKKTDKEGANGVLKAAADGLMKGIFNFGTLPRGPSNFKQKVYSNPADAALAMVMGEDLVKVLMRYAND
jgi:glyceraldehyde-3-phosphate dehydrogenase/erythrose-4-phosphate dehydrogenase